METYQGSGWEFLEALSLYLKDRFNIRMVSENSSFTGDIWLCFTKPKTSYTIQCMVKEKEYFEEAVIDKVTLILERWKLIQDQNGSI